LVAIYRVLIAGKVTGSVVATTRRTDRSGP
jgi:hypothetical protein